MVSINKSRRRLLAAGTAVLGLTLIPARALARPAVPSSTRFELVTPKGRSVEIFQWCPHRKPVGTILFSHGANSAPRYYERLIAYWVGAGYRVLAPLHVDSKEHPQTANYAGLASWAARIEDMRLLAVELGNSAFIVAGHSYGGLTAIAMGGGVSLVPQGVDGPLYHSGTLAVVAFSPPAPIPSLTGADGYAPMKVPALIQTGTRDVPPGVTAPDAWEGHLAPYHAAPHDRHHYALVLEGVDHYFGGLIGRSDVAGPQTARQLNQAGDITTLFLQAFAGANKSARRLLDARLSAEGEVRLYRK